MKKVLNVMVAVLLVVSLCSSIFNFIVVSERSQAVEGTFLREVGFTIQRLEGYRERGDEAEYITALSHIYSAYTQLGMMHSELPIVQNAQSFHDLWNRGIFYPEQFKADLDEIIEAMKLIKSDSDFDDINAAMALKMF